jgi:hypothetical protein
MAEKRAEQEQEKEKTAEHPAESHDHEPRHARTKAGTWQGLPIWAWVAIGVGVILVVWYMLTRMTSPPAASSGVTAVPLQGGTSTTTIQTRPVTYRYYLTVAKPPAVRPTVRKPTPKRPRPGRPIVRPITPVVRPIHAPSLLGAVRRPQVVAPGREPLSAELAALHASEASQLEAPPPRERMIRASQAPRGGPLTARRLRGRGGNLVGY